MSFFFLIFLSIFKFSIIENAISDYSLENECGPRYTVYGSKPYSGILNTKYFFVCLVQFAYFKY